MSILIVGSIALDSITTVFASVSDVLGGSAVYSAFAASFFSPVNLVGVIGEDFPSEYINLLQERGVNFSGVQLKKGKTFRWKGRYDYEFGEVHTECTALNVYGEPLSFKLNDTYRQSKYVFLGNINPELQLSILEQVENPEFIAFDTMSFWLSQPEERKKIDEILNKVDAVIINEEEARLLTGVPNLVKAGTQILATYGVKNVSANRPRLKAVVIKKGEHGAILFLKNNEDERNIKIFIFPVPAFPIENIVDPTGAGDTFAGAFIGYLSKAHDFSELAFKKATAFGTVLASFTIEDFSVNRLAKLSIDDIYRRYRIFSELTEIPPP